MKRKNAFTLIELLAVIVILAIIALIATPIILGIIEDTKKDAFARSVELVVSATDLDVMNKITDMGYEYELVDGKISDNKTATYELIFDKCYEMYSSAYQNNMSEELVAQVTSICNNEPQENWGGETYMEKFGGEGGMEFLLSQGLVQPTYIYNDLNLAKNTEGMNGNISYNGNGEEIYAVHNGIYCVTKTLTMDKPEVKEYVEGECNLHVTMTFSEFLNLETNIGDKVLTGNGQLIDLGKYGIRYQGVNPNNYVYFNCSDYDNPTAETCELWRIIGVVDGKVKLIRNDSIGTYAWDTGSNGTYDNNWLDASLNTYLNGDYLTTMSTKNSETIDMIENSTWYLRGHDTSAITNNVAYDLERTTGTVLYDASTLENTKVGLMYVSDYGFASSKTDTCPSTTVIINADSCSSSNWIISKVLNEWTFFPVSTNSNYVFYKTNIGIFNLHLDDVGDHVNVLKETRPVLYLKDSVQITGVGSQESPYQLSL